MQTKTLNIAFIGAGAVNFGGGEGPWNHAKRLEQLASKSKDVVFRVVAIADPWADRAQQVLENQRKNSSNPDLWKDTQVFPGYMAMLENVQNIDAAFIGVPPEAHGSTKENVDIELQCAKRKIHLFVEKPISCYPLSDVDELAAQLDALVQEHKLVISVGYMFRYSAAVRKIKEIIAQYGPPRIFNARYNCAYSTIGKVEWWDNDKCGGPIVEQGTHFCDLARYIVGDINLDSVHAIAIGQGDALGKLKDQPENVTKFEESLPQERRIVRSTAATWRFENGALGTLTHGVLLHGKAYETELEVWGDGYRVALLEPYTKCRLSVRFPESEEVKLIEFSEEDVYYEEVSTWLNAIITGDTSKIASSYADAMQTYRFTWRIRNSAERS
jgi:predicted dehydrogenase